MPNQNKMGVMPIPKLLVSMSTPLVISMLVQALYNVVDSMFVAQLNENALTAVSLVFPIQNLMLAVSVGTGVGMNALISRYLGEKRNKEAGVVAQNGMFLALISALVFALIGFTLSNLFMTVQTADAEIITYGTQYMSIVTIVSVPLFVQITVERYMQSTGKTVYNMIIQATGAIINIILDPILIFGVFGLPGMGVVGAAVATVVGQTVAAVLALWMNRRYNKELHVSFRGFRPDKKAIGSIYRVGVPSIIMQSIGSVMMFNMNNVLLLFSSTAAAVFGIYFKLFSFAIMPVFGITNALVPIVAFNLGAKKPKRIMEAYRLSSIISVGIMLLALAVFQLFPAELLSLFDASPQMIEIGVPALRTISLSFLFAGFCIVTSSMYQALGNGMYSLIVSVARQLVVLVPLAYLFAYIGNLGTVWWSFPLAEILSLASCIFLMIRIYRQKILPLYQLDT